MLKPSLKNRNFVAKLRLADALACALLMLAAAAPACTQYHALPRDGGVGGIIGVGTGTGGSGADAGAPDAARVDAGADRADAPAFIDSGTVDPSAVLRVNPDSQSFGMVVQNKGSASQTFMVSNNGPQASSALVVALGGTDKAEFQVTADGCNAQILAGNGSCQVTVRFAPTSLGAKSASLTVSSGGGGPAVAQLSGTGITQGTLAITPDTRVFEAVQQMIPGASQIFTVKNAGQATTGLLTTTLAGGDNSNFSITANTCDGHTLAAADSCAVTVQFTPVTPGSKLVTLSVAGAAGEAGVAQLSGTSLASPSLTITPTSKQFNAVTVNQNASATFVVANPGGVATGMPVVAVAGVLAADSGQFTIAAGSNGCTAAIPAGGSCMISVRFGPTTTGVKNGTLTVSASPGTSVAATLTGTGIAAGKLSISPLSQDFGSLLQGTKGTTAVTFSVMNSGASPTGTLQASVAGSTEFQIMQDNCSATVLAAQGSCTVSVVFAPTTASPSGSLQVVATNPADSASAGLSGIGLAPAKLTIAPTSGTFADTVVNQTSASPISFTVRNTGGVSAGTGTGLAPAITGTNLADFAVVTGMSTCTGALAAGAQCTVVVAFTPKTTGNAKTASLSVNATPGGPAVASLGGNGITAALLTLAPAATNAVAYGNVVVGVPKDQTFEVSNSGQQPSSGLQIAFANTTGPGFTVLTGAAGDCAANTPVAGTSKCNLRIHFAPSGRGTQTATLAVSAAVGGSPAGLTLTGTGQLPVGLTANPASVNLGNVTVNVSTPTSVMIVNGGDLPTSVPVLGNGNTAELTINSGCTAAIAGGASCTLSLAFKPSAGGARSATVTVTVTGASTMFTVSATGVIPCGAVGQPCCTGAGVPQCGPALTCAAATSTCACGGSGQFCCGGSGGTCTAAGTVCGTGATCGPPVGNGVPCSISSQCASNNCTSAICCAAGQSGCGGTCVNLTADNANCGTCGKTCAVGNETCAMSVCKANNGRPCAADAQCVSGTCTPCYPDRDGDGFGDKWASSAGSCGGICPSGLVIDRRDCMDDPTLFPLAGGVNPNATYHNHTAPFPLATYTPDPRDTSPDPWDWDCDDVRTIMTRESGGCGVSTCDNACAAGSGSLYDGTTCGTFVNIFVCANSCASGGTCMTASNGSVPQQCK